MDKKSLKITANSVRKFKLFSAWGSCELLPIAEPQSVTPIEYFAIPQFIFYYTLP